jgi:hypothetical protein
MSIPKRIHEPVSSEETLQIYSWVDGIPLSRPKRNVARDFCDGVLIAEIIHNYKPSIVELHNYASTTSPSQKLLNWNTLNQKIFRKLGFGLNPKDMEECANMTPGAVEKILKKIRDALFNSNSGTVSSSVRGKESVRTVQSAPPPVVSDPRQNVIEDLSRQVEDQQRQIGDLKRSIELLALKNEKLEKLIEIKDKKIEVLKKENS